MAMKTITCNIAKAASALCLVSLTVSVTKAQEDRGERLQESISASDQRTNFSARKAAPSKIDSYAFQELQKEIKKCQFAQQNFAKYQEKYQEKERKGKKPSPRDKEELKKANAEWVFVSCSLRGSFGWSVSQDLADAEANVADGFGAEALLQFSQDFGLRHLFELVVQGRLENAD